MNGSILANIYASDCIVRINPQSGLVTEWIVATGLFPANTAPAVKVLNGIAYDHVNHRLFVSAVMCRWWPSSELLCVRAADGQAVA